MSESLADLLAAPAGDVSAIESGSRYVGKFTGTVTYDERSFQFEGKDRLMRQMRYGFAPTGKPDRDLTPEELAALNATGMLSIDVSVADPLTGLIGFLKLLVDYGIVSNDVLDNVDVASVGIVRDGKKFRLVEEARLRAYLTTQGKALAGHDVTCTITEKNGRYNCSKPSKA